MRSAVREADGPHEDLRSGVERIVGRDVDESTGKGRPLSERARQSRRSVEAYLKGGVRPRWMERVVDIDGETAYQRRRLARAHRALREECAGDAEAFAARWNALARSWSFDELNALIEQHNEWYPVERDLPLNPRTGDYVHVGGRSYRREVLGPEFVLAQFPANLG